jgi:hypothetical protein
VHYNIHLRSIFLVKIIVPGLKKEISDCAGIYARVPPPERERREQRNGTAVKQNGGALNAKLCTEFTLFNMTPFYRWIQVLIVSFISEDETHCYRLTLLSSNRGSTTVPL